MSPQKNSREREKGRQGARGKSTRQWGFDFFWEIDWRKHHFSLEHLINFILEPQQGLEDAEWNIPEPLE